MAQWMVDHQLIRRVTRGVNQLQCLLAHPQRKAYVHLVRGRLSVNGQALVGGDALKISDESRLVIDDAREAELLVFDLAA